MADKIYRVGIIGCGGMGGSHTNAWKNHPRTEVVAAMDIDADRASAFTETNELAAHYTDFNQMFAQENLDIVSITTWQPIAMAAPFRERSTLWEASSIASARLART